MYLSEEDIEKLAEEIKQLITSRLKPKPKPQKVSADGFKAFGEMGGR